MAVPDLTGLQKLIDQLEERAARMRDLARPFCDRSLLVPVHRLAQDRATWGGDLQVCFNGWLGLFDHWVKLNLGDTLLEVAEVVERHARDLSEMMGWANRGLCPEPSRPVPPMGRLAGAGFPPFELNLPQPPREAVSMVIDPGSEPPKPFFGTDFLVKALGRDNRESARRAASLGACSCPPHAAMHPAWIATLTTTLYGTKGSWLEGDRDPRPWFKEVGARLITQLDPAPPGLEKESEDALEVVIAHAHDHPLDSAGNVALTRLLTRPGTLAEVSQALQSDTSGAPGEPGFKVAGPTLRPVLANLVADPSAGPLLRQAATSFAADVVLTQVGAFVADHGDAEAIDGLRQVGALFGALGSRSYADLDTAVRVADVGADAAKHVFEKVLGGALDAAKTSLAVAVPVEAGKTIVFALTGDVFDRDKRAREAFAAVKAQDRRGALQDSLRADLRHLTYLMLLADAPTRGRLNLNLDPDAFPAELPKASTRKKGTVDPLLSGIKDVAAWKRLVFPDGHLHVPDPQREPLAWGAFQAWAKHVSPGLYNAARDINDQMLGDQGFEHQVVASQ